MSLFWYFGTNQNRFACNVRYGHSKNSSHRRRTWHWCWNGANDDKMRCELLENRREISYTNRNGNDRPEMEVNVSVCSGLEGHVDQSISPSRDASKQQNKVTVLEYACLHRKQKHSVNGFRIQNKMRDCRQSATQYDTVFDVTRPIHCQSTINVFLINVCSLQYWMRCINYILPISSDESLPPLSSVCLRLIARIAGVTECFEFAYEFLDQLLLLLMFSSRIWITLEITGLCQRVWSTHWFICLILLAKVPHNFATSFPCYFCEPHEIVYFYPTSQCTLHRMQTEIWNSRWQIDSQL